ncbi:MAG: hypothetical protein AB7U05_04965 [Mangrovibacterium sp.]
MKNIYERRDNLYTEALLGLKLPTQQKIALLFHHIYSLKLGDEYLINSEEDMKRLVDFLNVNES